jgi:protocatechuate 3,4-dioxygenase beta subunit
LKRASTDSRRRRFIATAGLAPFIVASGGLRANAVLAATPTCGNAATPRQTEGPFFKPDSPRRKSLIDQGMRGEQLGITGRILTTSCQPINGALIDFWHCDANGNYDNRGYRFRGHQFSDAQGNFSLETLLPGIYPGRTRHIHVIVQAPNSRALTTQLYFPGEALNERDWIFNPVLLMDISSTGSRHNARFDFVLDAGARA